MNMTLNLLMPLMMSVPPIGPGCSACPVGPTGPSAGLPLAAMHLAPKLIQQPCPPIGPPAPLLMMNFVMPPGTAVAIETGAGTSQAFVKPIFGLRPGFRYRLSMSNIPGYPNQTLYPEVEVFGSLVPRENLNYIDFPAPIYFSQDDIQNAFNGTLITKVIYLEDPTKAFPTALAPGLPLEFRDVDLDEAIENALDNGRLVAIVRLGDRVPTAEELQTYRNDGTVLLPGQASLAAPSVPPSLPCFSVPFYDPILGPKLTPEECLTDGGDKDVRLGIGPRQTLAGLDPTDLAMQYSVAGLRKVTTSNEVCICSPRFVMRRIQAGLQRVDAARGVTVYKQAVGSIEQASVTNLDSIVNRVRPVANVSRKRPGLMISSQGLDELVGISSPRGVARLEGIGILVEVVEPAEISTTPNELTVTKEVSPNRAVQIGEVVTFTISYRNNYGVAVSDLLLSDSLSGRLEYVPGSAESDRPVNVTTAPNEAGSLIVRFEIPGPVPPSQTGVVKFQARVR